MKFDTNYCFMDDVVEGFTFRPECFINAQSGNDRKMGDGSGKVQAIHPKEYQCSQAA